VSTKELTKAAVKRNNPDGLGYALKNGGAVVWASCLIMGLGNLAAGQIIKTLIFLAIEIAFIPYMVLPSGGLHWLGLLPSLGDRVTEEVWNDDLGVYEYIQGDNSQQILLYAVATLVACVVFFVIWRASVRSGFKALSIKKSGKHVPTFIDDLKALSQNTFKLR